MWSCDDQGEGAQIHRWHTVRCNDGITRPVYIMEGNLGDIYHDWTHTNTEQDARRRVDGERRIDMMAELVMSLWPYSRDARRQGHVVSINRGVLMNAIEAVGNVVRGHVRVTDPDDSDEEPAHYCKPPNVCIPPGPRCRARRRPSSRRTCPLIEAAIRPLAPLRRSKYRLVCPITKKEEGL